jgi:chemotaxis protein histidine kinase CheA
MVEIPQAEYTRLVDDWAANGDRQRLTRELVKWQLEPVSKYFDRMAEQARALAERLGKGAIAVNIEPGDIRVDGAQWGSLFSEFSHIIRNAIDHGLETQDARAAAGKPKTGTLSFRASASREQLVFELEDDGCGIAWHRVREKAKSLGLPHGSHKDLVAALFHDGLSTRDSATQTSGRGVGLAALRTEVLERDGRIDASSAPGAGTTVTISFPLSVHSGVLADSPVPRAVQIPIAGNA